MPYVPAPVIEKLAAMSKFKLSIYIVELFVCFFPAALLLIVFGSMSVLGSLYSVLAPTSSDPFLVRILSFMLISMLYAGGIAGLISLRNIVRFVVSGSIGTNRKIKRTKLFLTMGLVSCSVGAYIFAGVGGLPVILLILPILSGFHFLYLGRSYFQTRS